MLVKSEVKIPEEDYYKLVMCSYAEISDYVEAIADKSAYPTYAYGFLFPNYYTKNGEYFVSWQHYNSCD